MNRTRPFPLSRLIYPLCLLFCFAKLDAQTCTGNLINNPGFEASTTANWNVNTTHPNASATITTDAHSGTSAFRGREASISQTINTTSGKQYTMRVWAKTTSAQNSSYIHLNVFGSTGPILSTLNYVTSGSYAEYSVAFVAPANAVTANIQMTTTGDSFTFVDDFCVTESTPTCAITATASNVQCHDNGTPSLATDDYFTYNYTAQKTGDCGAKWFVGSVVETAYAYGAVQTTGPLPISNGPSQLAIRDATIQNISYTLTVQPPATCSNGGGSGQIDLSLALQQLTASPAQYTSYSVKATVSNAGPQAATGVKVKFTKPTGVVYVGGNTHTVSQGTFNAFSDEIWTVGSIPANGSATLTVNYFLLNATAPAAYAQVTAHNETDLDSQPNNGTPPTSVQDDEASTGGGPNPNLPDLTLSTVVAPPNNQVVGVGANFGVSFVPTNLGGPIPAPQLPVTGSLYLSLDNVLSANDFFVGSGDVPITATPQGMSGTVPANTPAGQYYSIMQLDPSNTVPESNENNNVSVSVLTITVTNGGGLPNLTVSNVTAPPAGTVTAGGSLDVIFVPDNTGGAIPASQLPVTGRLYLSLDNVLSANDILVASGNVPITNTLQNLSGIVPVNTPTGQYYAIVQLDPNNTVPESNENNNVSSSVLTITVTGGGATDCNAITITPGQGQITIAGASAPHVLLKVFRPNWTVAFECLDGNCANPQVVGGLAAGSHFVEIKLLNAGWGLICTRSQTVNVSNFGGNGPSALIFKDNRQRLAFDKIYPNPAQYYVTLEVYSKEDQPAVFEIYDQMGHSVHQVEMELKMGQNELELFVGDWKSGTYNVIGRAEGGLPAYGRFLKAWEE